MIPNIILNVAALLVTLGILVTIHEFGHFWVARKCGVKVLRFSIGFGKAIKTWVGKDGVEYVIAPIPLGGYVKMLGQEDTTVADTGGTAVDQRHLSFAFKPLWQRMAIVAAGPIANFILAFFIFWLINVSFGISGIAPVIHTVMDDSAAQESGLQAGDEIVAVDGVETIMWQQVTMQLLGRMGETGNVAFTVLPQDSDTRVVRQVPISSWLALETSPDPVQELGIVRFDIPAIIASVISGGRAAEAGLLAGDQVISLDGISISGWTHWVQLIRNNPELDLDIIVKRDANLVELRIRPDSTSLEDGSVIGTIGASVREQSLADLIPEDMQREVKFNIVSAIVPALQETRDKSIFVLDSIKKMVVGLISVKNINGPITIAQVAGETATYGLDVYLGFLAILSISLGVLNLLPIPVLDGGHLFYYLIEAVTRRPVPQRLQELGLQLGLILVSGIMVLAIYNDVSRLL